MSNSWKVDATYIKDLKDLNDDILVITPAIKEFLNVEDGNKNFIVGTKGIGKTLFLRYKRLKYQEYIEKRNDTQIILIPQNDLVDRRPIIFDFGKGKIELLSDEKIWTDLWLLSILLSALKATKGSNRYSEDKELNDLFTKLNSSNLTHVSHLLSSVHVNPIDFLGEILPYTIENINELRAEIDPLISIVRSMNLNIVVFLDNIDELFRQAYQQPNLMIPAWYNPQIGLMNAALSLSKICHGIEVNASIRKEAYLKIQQNDPNFFELKEHVLDLTYTKTELKVIFVQNIKNTDKDKLVIKEVVHKVPINSFFGFNFLKNETLKEENVFDYIYRYTLQRPRDLMVMGGAIGNMSVFDKNPPMIKHRIHSIASEIEEQYINEITPHIDICRDYLNELYKLIDKNIFNYDELKVICCKFNNEDSRKVEKCGECSKTHIFCNLHNIGLLGILSNRGDKNYQRFLPPGVMLFKCENNLPESSLYLLHPVLYENLHKNNCKFTINTSITVGEGQTIIKSDLDSI